MELRDYYVQENYFSKADCDLCDVIKKGRSECHFEYDQCPLKVGYYFKKR